MEGASGCSWSLLRRGPPNYNKGSIWLELHKGSNLGPPFASSSFADLFLRTALNKTFVDLFGSSLWGLPSLGAFGFTFFGSTLDKSFVGLFMGPHYGASLQVQDYRGLHSKRVETLGSQNVHWGPKPFCWGPKCDPKSIQSYTQ